ncbi:MAG TPA: hypothetical protein VH333_02715 [Pseudonocardiaceae bacterium]|jgi:hypothetical protein|nr:hypothetical protein [Pseudonocardiaceae bacterium]
MREHTELIRELKSLRKGRGLFASQADERIGPALRAECGVTDGDRLVVVREKVAARLTELADQLPVDLRLAVLAALGITVEARLPLYQDRVYWAATRIDRNPRTVRRRVDEAICRLADLATVTSRGTDDEPADGWHTDKLRVVAVLDRERPEILQQRRIIANQDDLRELDLAGSLEAEREDLETGVLYGGTLLDCGMAATGRFGCTLALPRPLARGESYDFAVWFRLPTTKAMRPHLVCVPRQPCELFDLRVRFGRDRMPPYVSLLHRAFQSDVTDPGYQGRRHPVDRAGEVHLRFRQLTPGLAFGAKWTTDGMGTPT